MAAALRAAAIGFHRRSHVDPGAQPGALAEARGWRRIAVECSQHVVDELYVDNRVTQDGTSHRLPARARFEARCDARGAPYATVPLFDPFIAHPSCSDRAFGPR